MNIKVVIFSKSQNVLACKQIAAAYKLIEVFRVWNMKMHYRIIALLSAIFILLIACGVGSAWSETRITTNTADQANPSIWSNYIVWQDTRNGGSDIYLQNMATKVQTRVTANVVAEAPFVSGNRIVWQDKRNGNWDIYMYEISTKKTTRITTNTKDQTEPSAYGNYIVWTDTRNGGHDIYLQNLATKVQTRITSGTDACFPAIYGNNIAYATGNDEIKLYNITTKKTTAPIGGAIIPISLSLYGNRILYTDMYNQVDTYLYDFSTKKDIPLPFNYVWNPSMYSNKIVFEDSRNGNLDIYMVTL